MAGDQGDSVNIASTGAPESRSTSGGGPSIGRNARWAVLGSIGYGLGQWAQFAILARIGGAVALGGYAYAVALAAPVASLANLQLGFLQVSDRRDVTTFHEYRRLRLLTTAVAVAAIVGIARVDGVWRASWPVVLAVCAMRAADGIADIYGSLWQKTERLSRPSLATMLAALAALALMGAAAALGGGDTAAVIGAAVGSWAAPLFLHRCTAGDGLLRHALSRGARPTWRAIGRLAILGLPLALIVLLGTIHANVPRYLLGRCGGPAALGIFAAAAQLTGTGLMLVNAVGAAVLARFARLLQSGDSRGFFALVRRTAVLCALLGGAGVAASALVGKAVLALLYRPEFAVGGSALVVLSVAATFAFPATILGYALTAARVLLAQCVAVGASLVVLLSACALLVPRHGPLGAAWAVATASIVHLAGNVISLRLLAGEPGLRRARAEAPARSQLVGADVRLGRPRISEEVVDDLGE
jgi:O-antigen/teichoic acid export membrane protein